MQGLDETDIPGGTGNAPAIYDALPTSMTNKVLVQLDCATHALMWEGCSNAPRCIPASGIPTAVRPIGHGQARIPRSRPLIEWITNGTFDGADRHVRR